MKEFRRMAAQMDRHMQKLAAEDIKAPDLVINRMVGYLPDLHKIWTGTTDSQLMALSEEFPGFYRYALIMEEAFEAERQKPSRPYDDLPIFAPQHKKMMEAILTQSAALEHDFLAILGQEQRPSQGDIERLELQHRQWQAAIARFKTTLEEDDAKPHVMKYMDIGFAGMRDRIDALARQVAAFSVSRQDGNAPTNPDETPQWQPLSMLPVLTDLLAQQLEDVNLVLHTLQEARSRPHVLDDYTIHRVICSYTEQCEFITGVYRKQAEQWCGEATSLNDRTAVKQFRAVMNQVDTAMGEALILAHELSGGTINEILRKSDHELAESLLNGSIPIARTAPAAKPTQAEERRNIAKAIDLRMRALLGARCTPMEILAGMHDYLEGFKQLIFNSTPDERNELLDQYLGLEQFARTLEALAADIQSGKIQVP